MAIPNAVFRAHTLYNSIVHGVSNRYKRLHKIVEEIKPRTLLEIGVWRGERASEFIDIARRFHTTSEIKYFGFDLFELMPSGLVEPEGSRRTPNPTQAEVIDRLSAHIQAGVSVRLFAGNTIETLGVADLPPIDFAFIDGGHSYETVKSDWEHVEKRIAKNGTVVFDDFVNEEAVRREGFGVNRLISEIDRTAYNVTILSPTDWWKRPWGIFKNRLVMVRNAK